MRARLALIIAALVFASPADAAPVIPLIVSIGATWAGGAVAGAFGLAAGTTAYAAVQVGVASVIGLIAAKVMQPKQADFEQLANFAQPVRYMARSYGVVRGGADLVMTKFDRFTNWPGRGSKREYRVYVLALCAHEIDGIEAWYVDDRLVELGANGTITTEPYDANDAQIWFYRGTLGQAADPQLVDVIDEWTVNHDMAGIAYVIAKQKKLPAEEDANEKFPNGQMQVTPAYRGNNRILDPRTGQRGYTDNWALCFAHELVTYQGLSVDWDEVADEADHCDVLVAAEDGTMRRRWTFSGRFTDDMAHAEIRAQFLAAADGHFYERDNGQVGFRGGRWIEPTVTLTRADFKSIQISSVHDIDAVNEFAARYVEPARDFQPTPTGAWVHDPDGPDTRDEIKANGARHYHQAVALAKRRARIVHARQRISGTLKFVGYELRTMRFAALDMAQFSDTLEITRLTLNEDWMTWTFEGHSSAPADWLVGPDEYPQRPLYEKLDSSEAIDPVTSLEVFAGQSTSGSAALIARWEEQDDSYRQQLRYSISGTEAWQVVDVPKGVTRHEQPGLLDGGAYEWQIRNGRSGKSSLWSQSVVVTAVANTAIPPALPRFEVTGQSGQAVVDFDTPNSPHYAASRIYRGSGAGAAFADAALVQTVYGSPNISDGWTDAGLSAGTYRYWAVPINSSGRPTASATLPATGVGPVTVSVL